MRTPRAAALAGVAVLALTGACGRPPSAASPSPPPPPPMAVTPTDLPPPSPLPDPLPEVIATVNGRAIPLSHARIIVDQAFKDMTPSPAQRANAYRQALEQLITRELLYEEAQVRKVKPDEGAVERLRAKVRSEHKGEKEWKAFLAVQGLDAKTFVEELRIRSMVERTVQQEAEKIPAEIKEADARAYYAANPHLFLSTAGPLPFEDVRERITFQLVTFKRQEALNTLLTRLRSAAKIETFL